MRTRLAVVGALITGVAVLGGCSKSSTGSQTTAPGTGGPGTIGPSPSATATGRSPSGAGSPSSPTGTAQPAGVVIHTGTVLISEAPRNVLTDSQGFTLYYHTADTATVVCSGSCAATWPPVLAPSGTPTASPALPGQLGVRDDENGRQVEYNGHPLYRYSGDKAPGQATGHGVGKLWYVATPDLKAGH